MHFLFTSKREETALLKKTQQVKINIYISGGGGECKERGGGNHLQLISNILSTVSNVLSFNVGVWMGSPSLFKGKSIGLFSPNIFCI